MDFCQCEKCRAFNASHGGKDSAALLDFVNRVASEIKKEYPDVPFFMIGVGVATVVMAVLARSKRNEL